MSNAYEGAAETAREYYNSDDADKFYSIIWGGEDIHVGLYENDEEPIAPASHRTVAHMMELAGEIRPDFKVIDLGAGYGGSARAIAKKHGCHVTALNVSEVENERDRAMNKEQGLDDKIEVIDGNFEELPFEDNSFDLAWTQDSFLHSAERHLCMKEAARVMKPGARFVMTDPMQSDDTPTDSEKLQPILDRIHLPSLGSPGFYREMAKKYGLKEIKFEEHAHQLPRHYGRVREELIKREKDLLEGGVSQAYIDRMKQGLQHWVNGGNAGILTWGIFVFEKEG